MGWGSQRCSQGSLGGRRHRTFVPVLEGGHDEEADGLVRSLLENGCGQALVGPLQSCSKRGRWRGAPASPRQRKSSPGRRSQPVPAPTCRPIPAAWGYNKPQLPWVSPCSRTISRTPWKKPRYLGLGEHWSWINFTWGEEDTLVPAEARGDVTRPKGLPAASRLGPGMAPTPEPTHVARQRRVRPRGKPVPTASSAFCRGKPGKLPLQATAWGLQH